MIRLSWVPPFVKQVSVLRPTVFPPEDWVQRSVGPVTGHYPCQFFRSWVLPKAKRTPFVHLTFVRETKKNKNPSKVVLDARKSLLLDPQRHSFFLHTTNFSQTLFKER